VSIVAAISSAGAALGCTQGVALASNTDGDPATQRPECAQRSLSQWTVIPVPS
jgi:hypothetical protein